MKKLIFLLSGCLLGMISPCLAQEGIIYFWSPNMPISVKGIPIIRELAAKNKISLTILLDPNAQKQDALNVIREQNFPLEFAEYPRSQEFARHGALLHFPSLLYYTQGKIKGTAVRGFMGEKGYQRVIDYFRTHSRGAYTSLSSRQLLEAQPLPVTVTKIVELPSSDFGYYTKPVWNSRWVGVHEDWHSSYFFNLDTRELVDVGYTNDTYATPDDQHLYTVFWGSKTGDTTGIIETAEILKIKDDPNYRPEPLLMDSTMPADYQSVGVLRSGTVKSVYRVISGGQDLSYRDYEITHRTETSPPIVRPLNPTGRLCHNTLGDQIFGTPIISKDGREVSVSVYSEDASTIRVYEIRPDNPETCKLTLDLPVAGGKIAFQERRGMIAFHAYEGDQNNVYLYDRFYEHLYRLDGFSEQVGPGEIFYPDFTFFFSGLVQYRKTEDGTMNLVEYRWDPPN